MIPEKSNNSVSIPANFETKQFGINDEDFAHIVDIIQNQLYSDKPLALVREYCCNAYDANVMAGRKETPIRIILPSRFEPQLKIRDFGNGLNQGQMEQIFTRYGKSTKRDDNTTVGCFGIGSKAAFSYTASFLVNSYIGGIKTAYNCVLDETNVGKLITLGKVNTTENDGLEIVINIKQDDVENFRNICMSFFKYWDVMPEIVGFTDEDYKKIRGNDKVVIEGTGWKILGADSYNYRRNTEAVALMGNIAYPIKWESVKGFKELLAKRGGKDNHNLSYFITDNNMVFNFGIGEVKMSPSRETLQYTELTNSSILARIETVLDEVNVIVQNKISTAANLWSAKEMYDSMFNSMNGLSRLKGTIKTTYNNQVIDSNKIIGFDKWIKTSVLKTYYRRGSNVNHYCYSSTDYSWNSIECKHNTCVLEIDATKGVYIQKAVKYLESIMNTKTVYVLTFDDAVQRQEVFAATGLDDSFIIKYSTIADEVKNTISRNTSNGVVRVKKDGTIRSLKCITSDTHRSWHYRKVNDFGSSEHDMATGGIYIETDNNHIKNSKYNIGTLIDTLNNLGKYEGNTLTVHFIGQNYIDGKLMKNGNWVKFDDYVANKSKEIISKDKMLGLVAAFEELDETNGVFRFDELLVKLIKDNNLGGDIEKIADVFADNKKSARTIVKENLVVSEENKNTIKELYSNVVKQFPLLEALNQAIKFNQHSKEILSYLQK